MFKMKENRRLLNSFLLVTFFAILTTIYLTLLHYEDALTAPCTINSYFDCGTVNKSSYSMLFGIPVSIWGMLTYLFLFAAGFSLRAKMGLHPKPVLQILFGITLFGVLFSLALTGIELFVLRAVCIFCVTQQILIIVDLVLLGKLLKNCRRFIPLT